MSDARYELVVTAPAGRAIRGTLPEAVALAVIDFITGVLGITQSELVLPYEASLKACGVLDVERIESCTESMTRTAKS